MLVKARTIIFITTYPFNDDFALKYGFDMLKRKGFNIVILNVLNIIFPKASAKIPLYNKLYPVWDVPQTKVKFRSDLEYKLKTINGWKIVVLVIPPFYRILRVLKRVRVDYIEMLLNTRPKSLPVNKKICDRFFLMLYRLFTNPVGLFLKSILPKFTLCLLKGLPYQLLGIKYPKYVVLGSEIVHSRCYSLSKSRIIKSHSFDYDRYLRNKGMSKSPNIPNEEYYVHIADNPWGGHDFALNGWKAIISKSLYTQIINKFLDYVEEKTGKKILIAAHPKHTSEDDIYNGRPFLYFDTEQLIKYSCGIICHFSGAMNFAVIHNKPICLIGLKCFPKYSDFTMENKHCSKELNVPLHCIDTEKDVHDLLKTEIFSINQKSYREYMQKNVLSEFNSNKRIWEIVSDAIEGKD